MDTGGQSAEERQRQTAAEIARRKVMAAYGGGSRFLRKTEGSAFQKGLGRAANNMPVEVYIATKQENRPAGQAANQLSNQATSQPLNQPAPVQTVSAYKQTPINANVTEHVATAEEWKKYHSAWQGYYQKYYSEYYAKAAKSYLENEKLKNERARRDEEILETPHLATNPTEEEEQSILAALKQTVQKHAKVEARRVRKFRRVMPILAGVFVVLLVLFLQYNRLIFAPIAAYVSPGNSEDNGITALDPTVTTAVSDENKLMIPKLNVDVPVNFGISNDTDTINMAMENGVAQFSIPGANAMPGEIGNLVITGHSAGDIYSNNQYKFIFSGLERLVNNDLIYIDYEGVRYTYSVTKMETVEPDNVAALVYNTDKPMLTLITCTPLGTSRYRLLVTAEQINPAPSGAVQSSEVAEDAESPYAGEAMPENSPTFFQRIWNFLTGRS